MTFAFWFGVACGWLLATLLPLAVLGVLMLWDRWQRRRALRNLIHPFTPKVNRTHDAWLRMGSRSW